MARRIHQPTDDQARKPNIIGTRINERFRALGRFGTGQTWLADRVGMSPQGIQSIVAGRSARPRKVREIAHALQTSQRYLLGQTDEPGGPYPDEFWPLLDGLDETQLRAVIEIVSSYTAFHSHGSA